MYAWKKRNFKGISSILQYFKNIILTTKMHQATLWKTTLMTQTQAMADLCTSVYFVVC